MSRPMLPGQNSKYWGLDLNNYLLSLDRKISSLESFHSLQSTIIQNSGPGFLTGSWDYTTGETFIGTTISGIVSYEAYRDGNVNYITKILTNWKIEGFYIIQYDNDGKLEYPSGLPLTSTTDETKGFPYNCAFYAVYLFCEPEEDGSDTSIKTVLCPNYIFRGDCVMIGSYEANKGIFTPRVQTSSKTLYQSGQDVIHSYATITVQSGSLGQWPDFSTQVKNDQDSYVNFFGQQYFFCTNGINPDAILKNYNGTTKGEASYDVKVGIFSSDNEVSYIGSKSDKDLGCYYLAPSGNIYVQSHAKPTDWPTGKDYMLEATDPLTGKEGYVTGGLVYIGCVYCQSSGVYQWVSAKQNGVNPVILDVDNSNPHKILIENNQYWTGDQCYKIQLNKIADNHVSVSLMDYIKNKSAVSFVKSEIDFSTPKFRIFNSDPVYGESVFGYYVDSEDYHYSQISLTGDCTTGIILQGGDGGSKITMRHLDEDKVIFSTFDDGGCITLSNDPATEGCVLTGNGRSLMIKCGQGKGGSFEIYEDQAEDFMVSVNGEFSVNGPTYLGDTQISGSKTLNVYGQAILNKGFQTNSSGSYYFNSSGNIKCNDITFVSDIRLKTNLKPINSRICHEAVQNLKVNTYTYIKNDYNTLGLIAQDIEEQLPEYAHLLVHENEDGEKIVSEHKLLFILWEALKQEIKERKGGK